MIKIFSKGVSILQNTFARYARLTIFSERLSLVKEFSSDVVLCQFWHGGCNVTIPGWCGMYSLASLDKKLLNWSWGQQKARRTNIRWKLWVITSLRIIDPIAIKSASEAFADSWSCDAFFSATRECSIRSILDGSPWKAARYTDNHKTTTKNNYFYK